MQIIDAHHHLWDLEANGDGYPWLAPDDHDRGWGDTSSLKRTYSVPALLEDARLAGVTLRKSVHIQANFDPLRPVDETRWLQRLGDTGGSEGLPNAIVGFANLASPDVEAVLEAHMESSRFRGVRQVLNRHDNPVHNRAPRDFLADADWQRGFGLLAKYDLSFDAQIYYPQAAQLAVVAEAYPEVPVVIDHTLLPLERDAAHIEGWRSAVASLAKLPHVMMKISGFGMVERDWTAQSAAPFVLHCIDCFTPARIMFGSNFPVDKLMADYGKVWSAYADIVQGFSDAERAQMFVGSAERFYRI